MDDLPLEGDGLMEVTEEEEMLEEVVINEAREKWEVTKIAKKKSSKKRGKPVLALHKSSRGNAPNSVHHMRKLSLPGTTETLQNSFTVLNSCDYALLENLANRCNVNLGDDTNSRHEVLSAMKLEETVRAVTAEAIYMKHVENRLNE